MSGRDVLGWEIQGQHRPAAKGLHWRLVEARFGRGRIILCQLVPAEAWLADAKADARCAGRKLMENLIDYALAAAARSRPKVTAAHVRPVAPDLAVICAAARAGIIRAAAMQVDGDLEKWSRAPAITLTPELQSGAADGPIVPGGTVRLMWSPEQLYLVVSSAGAVAEVVEVWIGDRVISLRNTVGGAAVFVDGKAANGVAVARSPAVEASVPAEDLGLRFADAAALPLSAKQQGRHCLYFSANAVPMAEQWISAENELELLRVFFQRGVRTMHTRTSRRSSAAT